MYRDKRIKKREWRKRKKEPECQPEAELNIDTLKHGQAVCLLLAILQLAYVSCLRKVSGNGPVMKQHFASLSVPTQLYTFRWIWPITLKLKPKRTAVDTTDAQFLLSGVCLEDKSHTHAQ